MSFLRGATILGILLVSAASQASGPTDLLIKVKSEKASGFVSLLNRAVQSGTDRDAVAAPITDTLHDGSRWVKIKRSGKVGQLAMHTLASMPGVLAVQPNYRLRQAANYRLPDGAKREAVLRALATTTNEPDLDWEKIAKMPPKPDNLPIPKSTASSFGADPLFSHQWGLQDGNVVSGWKGELGEGIVVAVLDSGVDYTHEDLIDSMWRNPGETGVDSKGRDRAKNGIDDDHNGFIDDVVGWDFVSDDNKPFDLTVHPLQLLAFGGNPGHGTHCAGTIAAQSGNGKGIASIAPKAKIMALRFMDDSGGGSTAAAVEALQYAIKMGAKISSNSWGSAGDDPTEPVNQALMDVLEEARLAGHLVVVSAGNGDDKGKGYDNDKSPMAFYPASYPHENIISVAAIDEKDILGSFSNWGVKTVDIAAPGLAIFSTMVENKYSEVIADFPEYDIKMIWDGTSMAAPHVAGAAALYWADHPRATMNDVKNAILKSARPASSLKGKVLTGGKLSIEDLMAK